MKLHEFLNFNHSCPICEEPLHIYMQTVSGPLWKNTSSDINELQFSIRSGTLPNYYYDKSVYNQNALITISSSSNETNITLNNELLNNNNNNKFYFFFLCNPKGIDPANNTIKVYDGCYYRSSPYFQLNKGELIMSNDLQKDIINAHETYTLQSNKDDLDKIYILDLNWQKNKTTLWHYAVNTEQKKTRGFKPHIFEKEMDAIKSRPNLKEGTSKLLDRLDGWILMS